MNYPGQVWVRVRSLGLQNHPLFARLLRTRMNGE